jgi:hypothetical protein
VPRTLTYSFGTMLTPHHHVISLSVPLDARHASTIRVLASAVCADAGFTVDDIDDFRLGINEVVSVLADDPGDDPGDDPESNDGRLEVDFAVTPGRIDAVVRRTDGAGASELDELAQRILDVVVDHHEYDRGTFRLTKSASRRHLDDDD